MNIKSSVLSALGESEDVSVTEVQTAHASGTVVFVEGLCDTRTVAELIIKPLTVLPAFARADENGFDALIVSGQLFAPAPAAVTDASDALSRCLTGNVLVFGASGRCFAFDLSSRVCRSVTEPGEENVAKGAKDCFVENIRANTATLRAHARTPRLRFERHRVGSLTQTAVDIVWCDGVADPATVERVRSLVRGVHTDAVLTTGALEEAMFRHRLLPSVLWTERPDKLAADVLEGCVVLLADGLPFGGVMPCTLLRCLQAPEDYAKLPVTASIFRALRFAMLFVTLLAPALYTAMAVWHPEMIPRELAVSIEAAKAGVPFSTPAEILIMLAALEVLIEAGLRLPKNFGSAVSIVGAVVVGQATVSAHVVSPVIVVLIAFTAMAGYTIPNQDLAAAVRLARFVLTVSAALLGLAGLFLAFTLMTAFLCSAETLGVPFLSPFTSRFSHPDTDTFVRAPMDRHRLRPRELSPLEEVRR